MKLLAYDLHWFGEEKTEQPTAKKLRDARQKGQVAQSKDFNAVTSLLAVFLALSGMWSWFSDRIIGYFHKVIDLFDTPELGGRYFVDSFFFILQLSLPLLAIALVTGVVTSYAQVGVLFTAEPLKPEFNKINPLKGLKNMFSSRALVELAKSLAKAGLILFVSWSYINERLSEVSQSIYLRPEGIVTLLWDVVFHVIIRCSIILFIIAIFDYEFKRRKNKKELMMTKQEVKQEYKQSEGDPQLKGKIKEKQRQMAMSRMMQQVPKADVIITNPTHYAVALQYDASRFDAPVVLAKGQDLIAQNIKRIASEHKVPMIENKPLARELYANVEVGQKITPELYEAVAEILAYVYSLKNKVA